MATANLGRIKPVFRGAYAGGTAYVADDISVANNDGTQSDLYDESIIANQGLTFSVVSNGNLTVTV